jgi:hypothetical protein
MNPIRLFVLTTSAILALSHAQAQLTDAIILEKSAHYIQTTDASTTPTLDTSRAGGAYRFDVTLSSIDENSVSGITAPTVALAASSTFPGISPSGHNGGTLVYNPGNEWRYGSDGVGWNVETVGNLNALFANGDYTITAEGHTYTLNNTGFLPGPIPTLTMTGGSWLNGAYVIDVSQTLTITTNLYPQYATTGIGAMLNLNVEGIDSSAISFSRIAPDGFTINESANSLTLTIAPYSLVSGEQYEGFAAFNRIVAQDTSVAGVFAVAWWGNETSFVISAVSAVPESSTYAAFLGGAALLLCIMRRSGTRAIH